MVQLHVVHAIVFKHPPNAFYKQTPDNAPDVSVTNVLDTWIGS